MGSDLENQVKKRRTFAIISHPDAGKTTLTEKLLLYGGAIHLAGAVKAKASARKTASDWMEIEKQRGISISTSVLRFPYGEYEINLLDTPGHKDFSEDTYRTLVAADAAVMLIDAAKGVEPQTRKLFEVCRMRGLPIFTFMNKMDRPAREPLDLIDELEKVLGIRSCPMSWPIGMGSFFKGVYDIRTNSILLFKTKGAAHVKERLAALPVNGPEDPRCFEILGSETEKAELQELLGVLKSELELLEIAGDAFDEARVLEGQLTPVFFGSAMNNFGVQHFLESFLEIAPHPGARKSDHGLIDAKEAQFSGFIFKIQANMDPQHRDRVAFMRVASGRFTRGIEVTHGRLGDKLKLNKPLNFFGQEREIIEEAWPGDIVGLLDTSGELRIGDTLAEGRRLQYEGVPRFSPEFFSRVSYVDPLRRKQLKKGLDQLSEEGVIQVFHSPGRADQNVVLGAVGALQFEVLEHRVKAEYGVEMKLERLPYTRARWVVESDGVTADLEEFNRIADSCYLRDRDDLPVILFKTDWSVQWAEGKFKNLQFLTTAPLKQAGEKPN